MHTCDEETTTDLDVAALAARLQRMEDVLAITQLVARYGPAADLGDAGAVAGIWAEDGVYEAQPFGRWVGHGPIAGMIGGGHQEMIRAGMAHVLTPPHVEVDGDTARAWNHALNLRWDAGNDRFWVARLSANEWTLRRVDGRWRTVKRVNRNLDGADEARALFAGIASTGG
ncbi:nuclear transport factor 2 family protein [Trujillonella endophytica]|uniref:SnoaL-like domain-containing protein n=1 Tax=Trujillonella endophytica TaxID=673521 RepID=A0A1H8VYA2_9ACTN|nr:nuclear transport factor 2 family protein [Trujillella endophytica]SEP20376.1 SnoaL-like domain-containing protein [Trujillella endophytica]